MPYIGKAPSSGIRSRFIYTATAAQTTFTGADDNNKTLGYTDGEYVDVYLNGVLLDPADYTATSKTSVVLDSGATVSDIVEIVVYDTFSVFNGTFTGDLTVDGDTLVVDSTNNRVGIGTSPSVKLDIDNGSLKVNRGNSSGDIAVFRGLNAEKVKIDTDGIKFNGDTASANALDDYEEGTWTATIGNGTVNANSTRYVKIGQQVTVWGYLQTFSDRSTASAVNIGGLPFTSASDNFASGATFHRFINAGGDSVTAYIPQSTSTMTFYASNQNTAYTNVLHSQLSSTSSTIFFTISYRA